MMRYRSKPQEVEAIQWTGDNAPDVIAFGGRKVFINDQQLCALETGKDGAQGWLVVPVGHWIVRQLGDLSDYWPVDDDYFRDKYVPVEES